MRRSLRNCKRRRSCCRTKTDRSRSSSARLKPAPATSSSPSSTSASSSCSTVSTSSQTRTASTSTCSTRSKTPKCCSRKSPATCLKSAQPISGLKTRRRRKFCFTTYRTFRRSHLPTCRRVTRSSKPARPSTAACKPSSITASTRRRTTSSGSRSLKRPAT